MFVTCTAAAVVYTVGCKHYHASAFAKLPGHRQSKAGKPDLLGAKLDLPAAGMPRFPALAADDSESSPLDCKLALGAELFKAA